MHLGALLEASWGALGAAWWRLSAPLGGLRGPLGDILAAIVQKSWASPFQAESIALGTGLTEMMKYL